MLLLFAVTFFIVEYIYLIFIHRGQNISTFKNIYNSHGYRVAFFFLATVHEFPGHSSHMSILVRSKAHFLGNITKTYLYNFDILKPHFYIVKLGFTEVYVVFLLSAQNIDCGYSLEPPRRGGSNEYHNMYFEQKYEKHQIFYPKIFIFWW